MLHLYVKDPKHTPCYSSISEALSALPDCAVLPQSFPAPQEADIPPVTIHIAPGIYEEQPVIERPYVTLVGEDAATTILTGHLGAFAPMPDGSRRGTFRTATLRIHAHDFTARNLTFQNTAGYGHTVGQALALYADGDRLMLDGCRLLSSQDTLFTAPLPPTPAKPGGFTGPGEHTPRICNRQFYTNCYIQGDVDFIFGGATAYFQNCIIYSKKPGDRTPPESPKNEVIYGYATAASTPKGLPFGYVFENCSFESDCPPHSVYLGRPWREWAKTVLLSCHLGSHIHPAGWQDWEKPHDHFYYGEYRCTGDGAQTEGRAAFSRQLSDEEAARYTLSQVLGEPDGWKPLV